MTVALVVLALAGLLVGFAAGYLVAVRRTPRLLARMSSWELRELAARTATHRSVEGP